MICTNDTDTNNDNTENTNCAACHAVGHHASFGDWSRAFTRVLVRAQRLVSVHLL